MSGPAREDVYAALFAKAETLTWGSGKTLSFSSRRVKTFDDLASKFPALCQAESSPDQTEQTTRMPAKRTWRAEWLIYLDTGRDPDAIPASETNAVLDAVEALFPDPNDPDLEIQTLGGLVHKCWIEGSTQKFQGDLDEHTLIVVPISILVP